MLGVKCPEDVEKMGIDKYNAECRKIVMRYSNEWEVHTVISLKYILMYTYKNRDVKGTLRRRLTYIFFSFNKKFNI